MAEKTNRSEVISRAYLEKLAVIKHSFQDGDVEHFDSIVR